MNEDKKERKAIIKLTSRKISRAFKQAVESNIPVTYLEGKNIIRMCNGKKKIIGHVNCSSEKYKTPKIYKL